MGNPANGILKLNTIDGAMLDIGLANGRIIQTGTVSNIDAKDDSDESVIIKCLAADGMPPFNSYYPGTSLFLTRVIVRGFTTNGVVVALYYETFQALIPTSYLIRDHSSMTSQTFTHDPITFQPLQLSVNNIETKDANGNSISIAGPQNILCPVDALCPMRMVSITQVSVGFPTLVARDFFGYVNDDTWPGTPGNPAIGTGGLPQIGGIWTSPAPVGDPLPKGYWLITRADSDWSKFANYYTTEAEAMTFKTHDWSQLLVLRDPTTGLYAKPAQGDVRALMSSDYSQGLIRDDANGIGRWGKFPLATFKSVFGF